MFTVNYEILQEFEQNSSNLVQSLLIFNCNSSFLKEDFIEYLKKIKDFIVKIFEYIKGLIQKFYKWVKSFFIKNEEKNKELIKTIEKNGSILKKMLSGGKWVVMKAGKIVNLKNLKYATGIYIAFKVGSKLIPFTFEKFIKIKKNVEESIIDLAQTQINEIDKTEIPIESVQNIIKNVYEEIGEKEDYLKSSEIRTMSSQLAYGKKFPEILERISSHEKRWAEVKIQYESHNENLKIVKDFEGILNNPDKVKNLISEYLSNLNESKSKFERMMNEINKLDRRIGGKCLELDGFVSRVEKDIESAIKYVESEKGSAFKSRDSQWLVKYVNFIRSSTSLIIQGLMKTKSILSKGLEKIRTEISKIDKSSFNL